VRVPGDALMHLDEVHHRCITDALMRWFFDALMHLKAVHQGHYDAPADALATQKRPEMHRYTHLYRGRTEEMEIKILWKIKGLRGNSVFVG